MTVRETLFHDWPVYDGAQDLPIDLQGWSSTNPIFATLIDLVRPKLIIEVGTWKGASAIYMANLCAERGLDTEILCVDTWLGDEHCRNSPEWAPFAADVPRLYRQFASNVVHTGHQHRITPIQRTSRQAADLFRRHGIRAGLIYIDASHTYEDVKADAEDYLPLLEPQGVIFGDDWTFPEVRRAVGVIAVEKFLTVNVEEPQWWIQP